MHNPRRWNGDILSRVGEHLSVCVVRAGRAQGQSLSRFSTLPTTYIRTGGDKGATQICSCMHKHKESSEIQ